MGLTTHQKNVIRSLNNHIARKKRQLDKARSFFYSNVHNLEIELNDLKEKIKLYKHKINQLK